MLKSSIYGSHTNIWQIGLIMWCLKHLRETPEWSKLHSKDHHLDIYQSTLSNKLLTGGLTLGSPIDIKEETDSSIAKYSISLNVLIKECLLIQPPSRPTPGTLVARTSRGMERAYTNAAVPPYQAPSSIPSPNEPSSRWFSQDPHPEFDNNSCPPRSLRPSELPLRISQARIEQAREKQLEARRPVWADMLNIRGNRNALYRPGDSDPFAGLTALGNMHLNPSMPLRIGAGIAAGIGAGLEAGLDVVKEQLQAGINAGAKGIAEALNPPPPPPRNEAWEFLSSNMDRGPASAKMGLPPDEDALAPLPEINCLVRVIGIFGGATNSLVKLRGLYKGTTVLQLKGALQANGVDIQLNRMRLTFGTRTLQDHQTLAELGGRTTIRVEMI